MKLITGFFMAWGTFLSIPCPVRRWEESARPYMLAALPLVGAAVGGVWCAAAALLSYLPPLVFGLVLAVLPWLVSGFIHLDGYADVWDAVLSRRDLAQRQRILKDPHCGVFGVIALVLLMLGQWSLLASARALPWFVLLALPVASRACAALAVLHMRPMAGSQYAAVQEKPPAVTAFLAALLAVAILLPLLAGYSFAPAVCALVYWLCAWYGFRQLGGMNGDISGFALTLAELAGVAMMCLLR